MRRLRATTGRARARGGGAMRRPRKARRAAARGRASDRVERAPRRAARGDRGGAARRATARRVPAERAARGSGPSAGVTARTIRRSICRASLDVISWPQNARRRAWAMVATRMGRSPARWLVERPSSGSPRNRRRNSEWSSSTARQKRSRSRPSALAPATCTRPSGDCRANARSSRPSTSSVAENTPSRNVRVASPAWRADSDSMYGPAGRTMASTMR